MERNHREDLWERIIFSRILTLIVLMWRIG